MANKQIDTLYNGRAITSLIITILILLKDQHIHSGHSKTSILNVVEWKKMPQSKVAVFITLNWHHTTVNCKLAEAYKVSYIKG